VPTVCDCNSDNQPDNIGLTLAANSGEGAMDCPSVEGLARKTELIACL